MRTGNLGAPRVWSRIGGGSLGNLLGFYTIVFNVESSRASVLETLLTALTRLVRDRLAWPHRRRGLASDGVRYADARSSVGRRFRSATKLRLEWYGGVFFLSLLQQRSKHPREMVITPKAATSLFCTNQPSLHYSGPPALPTLLQHYCTTNGQYTTPPRPPWRLRRPLRAWRRLRPQASRYIPGSSP